MSHRPREGRRCEQQHPGDGEHEPDPLPIWRFCHRMRRCGGGGLQKMRDTLGFRACEEARPGSGRNRCAGGCAGRSPVWRSTTRRARVPPSAHAGARAPPPAQRFRPLLGRVFFTRTKIQRIPHFLQSATSATPHSVAESPMGKGIWLGLAVAGCCCSRPGSSRGRSEMRVQRRQRHEQLHRRRPPCSLGRAIEIVGRARRRGCVAPGRNVAAQLNVGQDLYVHGQDGQTLPRVVSTAPIMFSSAE